MLMNQTIFWSFAILGLFIWMLFSSVCYGTVEDSRASACFWFGFPQ